MDPRRTELIENVKKALRDKNTEKDILRATVELIDAFSDRFNWTGFYMLHGDMLEVGPYIGPVTEHTQITLNKGICGAAASQKKTIIINDVNADPRFLACSINTRSEIVVPLMDGETCLGEIDIDSNTPSAFTGDDETMLKAVAKLVVERLKEIK